MTGTEAHAKINLALVVGPLRSDGKHEVVTVLQRLALADGIRIESAEGLLVEGFAEDRLVGEALAALAQHAGVEPRWRATITKRIPVAAGLGGGSSDAAIALRLANAMLAAPLPAAELSSVAARVGADVPFFLCDGPQLGTGDGSELEAIDLPQEYSVLLVVPKDLRKESTAAVYAEFDVRGGDEGYAERRRALLAQLVHVAVPEALGKLPRNDLASSPLAAELERLGAFRADVSGAGPTVYGLFGLRSEAEEAARVLADAGSTILTEPAW
jgi:4-diphosphocytidyl-2-C-methyl-D-erythritol kinase